MANKTSVDGVITIAGNTVAEFTGGTLDETAATIDDSEISDTVETHQAGKTSWNLSIECHWDEADTTAQGAMTIGASVAAVFLPEGNTSGDVSRTGTATVVGKSQSIAIDSMVTQSFNLKGNGALVDGTVT